MREALPAKRALLVFLDSIARQESGRPPAGDSSLIRLMRGDQVIGQDAAADIRMIWHRCA